MIALKIWVKIEIFQHPGPVNNEILQKYEILRSTKNVAQSWFLPPQFCKGWYLAKKFWVVLRLWLKIEIFTTLVLQTITFGKITKFWVALRVWLKIKIFDHPDPAKG